ncbi:MAG: hypothetical protein IJV31_04120, partial [Clostridia bacterium]|nr:hypothetical protein [Clostridia bacterium]
EVEYIESTGEQLIDLDIIPKKDLNIEITMTPIEKTPNIYIGAAYSDQTDYRFFYTGNTLYFDIANQRLSVNQDETSILDQKITFNLGNYYIKKDNVQIATKTAVTKEPDQSKSIYVFGGYFTSFKRGAKMKVYSLKIWDNNMLVRDMIPCYRKSDGEVGMYDIVTDTFFENKGTGTFEKGEDVK